MASCACIYISTKIIPDSNDDDPKSHDTITFPSTGLVLCVGCKLRIANVNGMVRLLASMAPAGGLLGTTKFEEAQVESWLSYMWYFVELPLHLLGAAGRPAASNLIHSQLRIALGNIESQLKIQNSGFLVGRSTTIADICLAVALKFNSHLLHEVLAAESFLGAWMNKTDVEYHIFTQMSKSNKTTPRSHRVAFVLMMCDDEQQCNGNLSESLCRICSGDETEHFKSRRRPAGAFSMKYFLSKRFMSDSHSTSFLQPIRIKHIRTY